MGPRSCLTLALAALGSACCPKAAPVAAPQSPPTPPPAPVAAPAEPPKPKTMAEKVVADFEAAVKTSKDAYVDLFDFTAVGEMEILLHRYDLLGRLENLPEDLRGQFAGEGAVPYSAEREKHNVGGFYKILGQRTVGTGGCTAHEPRTQYSKELATFPAFPAGALVDYEPLRQKALGYVAKGGLVAMTCSGGKGGIALVWTERPNARGYDLITIYDD